jgi:inorganic pyrophosphatase
MGGSAAAADVVIPACAAVGVAFALWQWFLVSRVKVSAYAAPGNGHHGGPVFRMEDDEEDVGMGGGGDRDEEEEEEGAGDGTVAVARCAEIQSAISVGEFNAISTPSLSFATYSSADLDQLFSFVDCGD